MTAPLRILETAVYVDDLPRAAAFYRDVMGLAPMLEEERLHAFDVGGTGVLLLFLRGGTTEAVVTRNGTIPPHDATGRIHFAFGIGVDDLPAWRERLATHGVAIEGTSDWMRGGHSLYFRDPDGNLLELAAGPGLWPGY